MHFDRLFLILRNMDYDHCLVFISIKFSYLILSYLILRVYESGLFSFFNSKRFLHLAKFLLKEPITPDMLLKLYNSVFKDMPLQNFCAFPSYYKLRGAILLLYFRRDICQFYF
jgi:hypothetical protein